MGEEKEGEEGSIYKKGKGEETGNEETLPERVENGGKSQLKFVAGVFLAV